MFDSLLTVPKELTQPERDNILNHYKNLPKNERNHTNHFDIDLPERPTLFVKYGDSDVLVQASTQSFFYALAQKDNSAPGIPKVYDAFRQEGRSFFVMERINMPTLSDCDILEDEAVQSVASAIKWLLAQISSVPNSVFGRISEEEACVWHGFFNDDLAPVPFVNSKVLTKYVIEAFLRRPGRTSPPISFSDDLFIYHSDIRKDNFLYNMETGDIWIIDFQHIGALPQPFQTFAFFNVGNSFAAAVGRRLGHKPSDIANELTKAACVLQQIGGRASLKLDKFGERVYVKRNTKPTRKTAMYVGTEGVPPGMSS